MLVGKRSNDYIYFDGKEFVNENKEAFSREYMKEFISYFNENIKFKTEINQFPLSTPGRYMSKMKFYHGETSICSLYGYGDTKEISKENCIKMMNILNKKFG